MKPYLVTEVQNYTGDSVKKYTPTAYGKLMTAEEASVLTDLMEAVVSDGTASKLSGQSGDRILRRVHGDGYDADVLRTVRDPHSSDNIRTILMQHGIQLFYGIWIFHNDTHNSNACFHKSSCNCVLREKAAPRKGTA